jgi:hypothetical protein
MSVDIVSGTGYWDSIMKIGDDLSGQMVVSVEANWERVRILFSGMGRLDVALPDGGGDGCVSYSLIDDEVFILRELERLYGVKPSEGIALIRLHREEIGSFGGKLSSAQVAIVIGNASSLKLLLS